MGRKNNRIPQADTSLSRDLLRAVSPRYGCSTGYAEFDSAERAWVAVDSYAVNYGVSATMPNDVYCCDECGKFHMASNPYPGEWETNDEGMDR